VVVGEWNLGKWSKISATLSLVWLIITSAVLFLPQKVDPVTGEQTSETYNYTWVVVSLVLACAAIYWYLPRSLGGARHHFKGPHLVEQAPEDAKTTSINN